MEVIRGRTADDAWRQASHLVLSGELEAAALTPSRAGDTYEVLHVLIEIEEPQQRWTLSRRPAINPAFAVAETIWMLAGMNDSHVLNYWFPGLPRYSGPGPTYPGAYGYRLVHHFGINQLRRAYEALAANPASRQVLLQIWDASKDLPDGGGSPASPDVPCNVLSLLKVRGGRLHWTQIMRSTDLHRGLPYDLVQFSVMHEIFAGWLGLQLGAFHHWNDSLHAYRDSTTQFTVDADATLPRDNDSFATDFARGQAIVGELYRRMETLTTPGLRIADLWRLSELPDAPTGYQNFIRLLVAESARRRRHLDEADAVMSACTNPQLAELWRAWRERIDRRAASAKAV